MNPSNLSLRLSKIILNTLTQNIQEINGPLVTILDENVELAQQMIGIAIDDILNREREISSLLALSVEELRNTKYDSPERICEKIGNASYALEKYRKLPKL